MLIIIEVNHSIWGMKDGDMTLITGEMYVKRSGEFMMMIT